MANKGGDAESTYLHLRAYYEDVLLQIKQREGELSELEAQITRLQEERRAVKEELVALRQRESTLAPAVQELLEVAGIDEVLPKLPGIFGPAQKVLTGVFSGGPVPGTLPEALDAVYDEDWRTAKSIQEPRGGPGFTKVPLGDDVAKGSESMFRRQLAAGYVALAAHHSIETGDAWDRVQADPRAQSAYAQIMQHTTIDEIREVLESWEVSLIEGV